MVSPSTAIPIPLQASIPLFEHPHSGLMIYPCIYREFPSCCCLSLSLCAPSRSPGCIFPAPSHLILDNQMPHALQQREHESLTEDGKLPGTSATWQGQVWGSQRGGHRRLPGCRAIPRQHPVALQRLSAQDAGMLLEHPCRQWEDGGIKPMFAWPFPPSSILAALSIAGVNEPHLFWKSRLFSNPLL